MGPERKKWIHDPSSKLYLNYLGKNMINFKGNVSLKIFIYQKIFKCSYFKLLDIYKLVQET